MGHLLIHSVLVSLYLFSLPVFAIRMTRTASPSNNGSALYIRDCGTTEQDKTRAPPMTSTQPDQSLTIALSPTDYAPPILASSADGGASSSSFESPKEAAQDGALAFTNIIPSTSTRFLPLPGPTFPTPSSVSIFPSPMSTAIPAPQVDSIDFIPSMTAPIPHNGPATSFHLAPAYDIQTSPISATHTSQFAKNPAELSTSSPPRSSSVATTSSIPHTGSSVKTSNILLATTEPTPASVEPSKTPSAFPADNTPSSTVSLEPTQGPSTLTTFPTTKFISSSTKPSLTSQTNEVIPTASSSTNATGQFPHSGGHHHKTAIAVGSVVGGLAATALLHEAVNAMRLSPWIGYVLAAISTTLGIGATCHTRRLIIKRAILELPDTTIALFITVGKSGPFKLDESVVVWQVNAVNARNDSFTVDIPCRRLRTRLFFGTYSENDDARRLSIENFGEAPAILEDQRGSGPVSWRCGHLHPENIEDALPTAENHRLVPTSIALGTGRVLDLGGDENSNRMIPFMRIAEKDFQPNQTYELREKLYLRAFRINSDCQAGQISTMISNSPQMLQDELTRSGPIEIDWIAPLTTWNITQKQDGSLALVIGVTSKDDKREYKHECTVLPEARRGDDHEALFGSVSLSRQAKSVLGSWIGRS